MVREGFVTNLLAYQHVTWVTCTKSLLPEVTKRNSHESLSFAIINDLCSFDVDHLGDICIQTHTIKHFEFTKFLKYFFLTLKFIFALLLKLCYIF